MMKKYIFALALASCSLTSCLELDVPPMNIVQDKDIFTSENGVMSYISRIYSQLPVEDFRYSAARGFNHFWIIDPVPMITGEAIGRDWCGAHSEDFDYYGDGYKLIRDVNYFLETLPAYESYFTAEQVNIWKGEALFARGVTYFALVKRYGGVPLVNSVLKYPEQSIDELKIARSSEEAIYNQIYTDLTDAFKILPEKAQRGRATRYAAAAFNSRAMLFAGSIAKHNKNSNLVDKDGNRLCGIDAAKARDFYQKSYDEAKKVEGHHNLYMKNWKEDDKEAQYQNFINTFFDESSEENIFVKEYSYPNSVHGYDAYCVPRQAMGANGYATLVNPTLDFVEMFDGLPKDANGRLQNFDANGHYKMYSSTMELFANAEPRLRATVILPGDEFKGENISIYRGLYTKTDAASGISRIIPDAGTTEKYENIAQCKDYIVSSPNPDNQTVYTLPDGTKMNAAGLSGPFASDAGAGAMSGFSVRKWLNPDMPKSEVLENNSTQTWIEMRYAEVLLNRAEAAYELAELGAGAQYKEDAFACINLVRRRAGADLLATSADLNDFSIIQTERRKELSFENKTWWDLKRWRLIEKEQQSTLWRILMPFYAVHAGKYFFDVRAEEDNHRFTFDTRWYYKNLPGGSIEKNPLLIQNPGY